jgi:hypothetical protein
MLNMHRTTLSTPLKIVALWIVGLALTAGAALYLHHRNALRHPLYGTLSGWQIISGHWSERSNVFSNSSYGRGDMLLARDSQDRDYQIAADIRFDLLFSETQFGDAGLIIRATDPEPGVDSYRGYYAGLRPNEQTVVLGRASYDWRTLSVARLNTPISTGDWYHLAVSAKGCRLHVEVTPRTGAASTTIDYRDEPCLPEGGAGLRSFYVQASWRNVRIGP